MRIHKEGHQTIGIVSGAGFIIAAAILYFTGVNIISILLVCLLLFVFGFILNFFRNPPRVATAHDMHVLCPADGKVVVIEKVYEPEHLKTDCIQVSIFMSPLNVHVNRYPITGVVSYVKYHAGLYLVAWHPKSSTHNERTSVAIKNDQAEILMRQIAGKVARRIVWYAREGEQVLQGEDMGFIKFGSRVDVFLPLTAKVLVQLDQVVRGNETVLADLS